jgi:hypothetical protein
VVKDETPPAEPRKEVTKQTAAPMPETTKPVDATPLAGSLADAEPGLRDVE